MEKNSWKSKKNRISIDFFHRWNSKELQYYPHGSEIYYEGILQDGKKQIWRGEILGYKDLLQQSYILTTVAAWIYADAGRREWGKLECEEL